MNRTCRILLAIPLAALLAASTGCERKPPPAPPVVDDGKIHEGDPRDRVITLLGAPNSVATIENEEVLLYTNGRVTLVSGLVTGVELEGRNVGEIRQGGRKVLLGDDREVRVE